MALLSLSLAANGLGFRVGWTSHCACLRGGKCWMSRALDE